MPAIVIFASLKWSCDLLSTGFALAARRQRQIIIIGCTQLSLCKRAVAPILLAKRRPYSAELKRLDSKMVRSW
jgi:hypothetical protein